MAAPRSARVERNTNPGGWAVETEKPITTLLGSCVAVMFDVFEQVSTTAMLLTLPVAAWEFSFGLRMAFKGFNTPITEPATTSAQFEVAA